MLSGTGSLANSYGPGVASFRDVRSQPLSSICCWWGRCERCVRRIQSCPSPSTRVARELEQASNLQAVKLTQAAPEVATKKSKVLSNSVSVRARLQVRLAPLGVQASREERNVGGIHYSSANTVVRRARVEKS